MSDSLCIPKVFHQVWLGPAEMRPEFVRWAWSWRDHHPDWRLVLWMDEPREMEPGVWHEVRAVPPLVNAGLLGEIRKIVGERPYVAAVSDLVRYEIVAREGGVYLDTDVECLRPLGSLLDGVRLFVADEYGPCGGNYCFGATPNHPAMWSVVRDVIKNVRAAKRKIEAPRSSWRRPWTKLGIARPRPVETVNPVIVTGPLHLNKVAQTHPECVVFPSMLFNPLAANHDWRRVRRWPEVSVANHHFAGTWYDREKQEPPAWFVADPHGLEALGVNGTGVADAVR